MTFYRNNLTTRRFFIKHFLEGLTLLGVSHSFLNAGVCLGNIGKAALRDSNLKRSTVSLKFEKKYERKTDSYTQGFAYEFDSTLSKGVLYESGGRYGRSLLRKVEADTGTVLHQIKIPNQYFAEGLALVDNKIYLLTWNERTCFVYDKNTFEQINEFRYSGEGWGLTYDGNNLLMSNGSSKIRVMDPESFRQIRMFDVHFNNLNGKRRSVFNLNELEFVNNELWANVYQQKYVVRIDPHDGALIGNAVNFSSLVPSSLSDSSEYVLNGIAFDRERQRLYVTGKCWPVTYIFKVETEK